MGIIRFLYPYSDPAFPRLSTLILWPHIKVLPFRKESKSSPGYISCAVSCLKLMLPEIIAPC
ncbi:hypothetical protein SCLCIDRAFT_1207656 [Scleroderma citrinum Foug A]|uniref:Uncharacterized protein n=1 Tax=Scleroderma citrinum Foug A TaxID=1036808 RepID=A0A0C3A9B6_9AGAM|nr:hypothetical protein SCLCIDRAFT_1207656 [Scleroderma citrinum Foug A]